MRASLLLIIGLFAAASSAQEGENVLVLDARVADGELHGVYAAQLNASIRFGIQDDIGKRMVATQVPFATNCDEACIAKLAEKHGAAWVVAPTVYNGDNARLVVRVHDRAGSLVAEGERAYTQEIGPVVVESLTVQLLSPRKYAGKVTLRGVPEGAEVNIDGIPVPRLALRSPLVLRVGTHNVEVVLGADWFEEAVEVTYKGEHTVEVKVAGGTAAPVKRPQVITPVATGFPSWPGMAAGGVAAAAAVAGLIFTIDWAVMPLYRGNELAGVGQGNLAGVSHPVRISEQLDARGFAEARTARNIDLVAGVAFLSAAAIGGGVSAYLFTLPEGSSE